MSFIWPAQMKQTMREMNKNIPAFSDSIIEESDVNISEANSHRSIYTAEEREKIDNFYQLSVDEKVELASAIAIGSFQEAEDGLQRAIITEFLKKDPDIDLYYDVGDEYASMSSYPNEHEYSYDKSEHNFIVFFAGNPPMMRTGTTYHGDRISGLNDIPVKLLREKCNPPSNTKPNN
jgi:hypothetical protein